jgi:hypothetical protein
VIPRRPRRSRGAPAARGRVRPAAGGASARRPAARRPAPWSRGARRHATPRCRGAAPPGRRSAPPVASARSLPAPPRLPGCRAFAIPPRSRFARRPP